MDCQKNECKKGAKLRPFFYPKADVALPDDQIALFMQQRAGMFEQLHADVCDIAKDFLGKDPDMVVPLPSGGTFHAVFRVDAGADRFAIRVALPVPGYEHDSLGLDAWAYKLLKAFGIPGITMHTIDRTGLCLPYEYAIMDFVQGQTLSVLQDPATQYLDPALLAHVGQQLAAVHAVKLPGFGRIHINAGCSGNLAAGTLPTWQNYVFQALPEHIAHCVQQGVVTIAQADLIMAVFEKAAPLLTGCTQGRWLHGDLGGHNLFANNGKLSAMIDWEDCMSGDEVFDLAYWGTFFKDHMLDQLLVGYYPDGSVPDDFYQRYWLYYLRVALAKTVHRARFGYADAPGRPPASGRIFKALEHCKKNIL